MMSQGMAGGIGRTSHGMSMMSNPGMMPGMQSIQMQPNMTMRSTQHAAMVGPMNQQVGIKRILCDKEPKEVSQNNNTSMEHGSLKTTKNPKQTKKPKTKEPVPNKFLFLNNNADRNPGIPINDANRSSGIPINNAIWNAAFPNPVIPDNNADRSPGIPINDVSRSSGIPINNALPLPSFATTFLESPGYLRIWSH